MIVTTDCTGRGGPLDCHGTGCVECLIEPVRVKIGQWKYYYRAVDKSGDIMIYYLVVNVI